MILLFDCKVNLDHLILFIIFILLPNLSTHLGNLSIILNFFYGLNHLHKILLSI
jgi:hypothetical protein